MRRLVAPPLDRVSAVLDRPAISPNAVTGVGAAIGIVGCVFIARGWFLAGLGLFLVNRVVDGLDGPLARRRPPTTLGPMFDLLADHLIYEGFVIAMAIVRPEARLASVVLVSTYVMNSVSVLVTGQLLDAHHVAGADERGLRLPAGFAEGTETIAVYVLMALWPDAYELLAWIFSAVVAATVLQRLVFLRRSLGRGAVAVPADAKYEPAGDGKGDEERDRGQETR